jgi:hypothetical protein
VPIANEKPELRVDLGIKKRKNYDEKKDEDYHKRAMIQLVE